MIVLKMGGRGRHSFLSLNILIDITKDRTTFCHKFLEVIIVSCKCSFSRIAQGK